MVIVQAKAPGYLMGSSLSVAGEHYGADALPLQALNGLGGGGLFHVTDLQKACVGTVDGQIHHGGSLGGLTALGNLHTLLSHQAGIAGGHRYAVHLSGQAVAGLLVYLPCAAGIQRLAPGGPQALGNGMIGPAFGQGSGFQEGILGEALGREHAGHLEHALGQGAGLVEHDGLHLGQGFQIVAALDQDTAAGSAADAAEEGEGNADDQRTGAADDQEGERTAHPDAPLAGEQAGQDGQSRRADADGGGIIPGELGDEVFRLGLFQAGVFHQLQNAGHGGLAEGLGYLHPQHLVLVYAAGNYIVAGTYPAGAALAGEGAGVDGAAALQHNAVQRDFLAGADQNYVAHSHGVRVHLLHAITGLQVGVIRADVHESGDVFPALTHRVALEQLADLVEQHNGGGFPVLLQGQRAHGGNGHEEVFVEDLALYHAQEGFAQHVVADDQVGDKIQRQLCVPGQGHKGAEHPNHSQRRNGNQDAAQHAGLFSCHR